MARALLVNNPVHVFGELYLKPSHRPPPGAAPVEKLLAGSDDDSSQTISVCRAALGNA